jgi:hypothetical protein
LDVLAEIFDRRAEDHASDASETIDADFYHDVLFVELRLSLREAAFNAAWSQSSIGKHGFHK